MLVLRAALASPFVRKVRIAASVLGLDDRIEIAVADTGDREDSLRRQNPLGKIPALILESGEVLFDSAVIVEYLDWLAGGAKIIPAEPAARFRSLTQQALADGVADAAVLLRYEALWRDPDMRSEKWMAYQSEKIARALAAFERSPPEELGDIGTIALASALGYLDLRFEGSWRVDHPRLVSWLDVFSDATPSFEATRFHG
jgi:glutathione S-transferase